MLTCEPGHTLTIEATVNHGATTSHEATVEGMAAAKVGGKADRDRREAAAVTGRAQMILTREGRALTTEFTVSREATVDGMAAAEDRAAEELQEITGAMHMPTHESPALKTENREVMVSHAAIVEGTAAAVAVDEAAEGKAEESHRKAKFVCFTSLPGCVNTEMGAGNVI